MVKYFGKATSVVCKSPRSLPIVLRMLIAPESCSTKVMFVQSSLRRKMPSWMDVAARVCQTLSSILEEAESVLSHLVQSTWRWSMCCRAPDITRSGMTSSSLLKRWFLALLFDISKDNRVIRIPSSFIRKIRRDEFANIFSPPHIIIQSYKWKPSFHIQLHHNGRRMLGFKAPLLQPESHIWSFELWQHYGKPLAMIE